MNSSRGNKYYGECVGISTHCLRPASQEAAPDTETDRQRWAPPFQVRPFSYNHLSCFLHQMCLFSVLVVKPTLGCPVSVFAPVKMALEASIVLAINYRPGKVVEWWSFLQPTQKIVYAIYTKVINLCQPIPPKDPSVWKNSNCSFLISCYYPSFLEEDGG